MTKYIKSTMFVIAGLCWITFAAIICLFFYAYLGGGAGLQAFGFLFPPSSGTVLIGLIHFVGFSVAALACFTIGVGLLAYGVTPPERPKQ
jgi:hypothetical protein